MSFKAVNFVFTLVWIQNTFGYNTLVPQVSVIGNSVIENKIIIDGAIGNAGIGGLGLAGGLSVSNGVGLSNLGVNVAGLGGTGITNNAALNIGKTNAVLANSGFINLAPVSAGGVLPVSSCGPIVPAGLNVLSDNSIEGAVLVNAELPLLSTVAFEGPLASDGIGVAACGCGNGNIGILSESYRPVASVSRGIGMGVGINGLAGLGGLGLFL